ncbi:uncharacterized protein LOC131144898 [Malania oleifera]|uniref:uncharacterized protein LOC131144898 n=1 Tax=Malania oleifera TaxID=397392 RepID=UPI0025AE95F7|nr:uncharacterized protein LOC131144898 [Malania oleifera]
MEAAALIFSHSTFRLPTLGFAVRKPSPKLGKSIFSIKETADGFLCCASQGNILPLTVSAVKSDGNRGLRPLKKNTASGRISRGKGTKTPQPSNNKLSESSNQEEIIALFRRIQSSISKEKSPSAKKGISKSSVGKASAESVLEVLRQSRKQVKGSDPNNEGDNLLTRKTGVLKKERRTHDSPPEADLKLKPTRPPSKFVKSSPIPSPSALRGTVAEQKSNAVSVTGSGKESNLQKVEETELPGKELQRVEEMTVAALKDFAKSRGIKGYSKLRKSELVDLLKYLNFGAMLDWKKK